MTDAGRISLYKALDSNVSFPACSRHNKYLTNLVFSVPSVSYESAFFPVDLRHKRENVGKKLFFEIVLISFALMLPKKKKSQSICRRWWGHRSSLVANYCGHRN